MGRNKPWQHPNFAPKISKTGNQRIKALGRIDTQHESLIEDYVMWDETHQCYITEYGQVFLMQAWKWSR